MNNATITFRTDEKLKNDASAIFENMGMSLSSALNIFMRQTVRTGKYPCSIEADIATDISAQYPKGFFELFGAGKNSDFTEEPEELDFDKEKFVL